MNERKKLNDQTFQQQLFFGATCQWPEHAAGFSVWIINNEAWTAANTNVKLVPAEIAQRKPSAVDAVLWSLPQIRILNPRRRKNNWIRRLGLQCIRKRVGFASKFFYILFISKVASKVPQIPKAIFSKAQKIQALNTLYLRLEATITFCITSILFYILEDI